MTTAADLAVVSSRLEQLLAMGDLRSVLQPVVDLADGSVVAHEALLRGPRGSGWEAPEALLTAARVTDRVEELDMVSLRSGIEHLADRGPGGPSTLFLNLEPRTLTHQLARLLAVLDERPSGLQVVVELRARSLAADPSAVVAGAQSLRAAGCAVAVAGLGTDPRVLAHVPVLMPEVLKLDVRRLRTGDEGALVVAQAVRAHAARSGAEVVAEGVETEQDRALALAIGATLGQGWLLGRPDAEPRVTGPVLDRFRPRVTTTAAGTPFEQVGAAGQLQVAPRRVLHAVAETLEQAALQLRVPPIVLTCSPDPARPGTGELSHTRLAARWPTAATPGADGWVEPVPGVRGRNLHRSDPLAREWDVLVLGMQESVGLLARDLGDDAPDADRRYEFTVTHDPVAVAQAGRSLLGRMGRG
ncbi:MAG TPA: EAL domain-containing protein [Actinotalea sp.]|nr:EAL domain-containing protein [Actinotalea sp.]